MELHSLYLAPTAHEALPMLGAVTDTLRELHVIGPAFGPQAYRTAEAFGRHVVFAGCSVNLVTEPLPDGRPAFSHVVLHGPMDHARLVTSIGFAKPRCPRCRRRIDEVGTQSNADSASTCPACQQVSMACELDWRQYGLCGRLLVEIVNVFPGEATPSDTLIQALHDATAMTWRYAWARYLGPRDGAAEATTT